MNSTVKQLLIWMLTLGCLLVGWRFVVTNMNSGHNTAKSITDTLNDVDAGKVSAVTVNGAEMTGTYKDGKDQTFSTTIPGNYPDLYKDLRDHGVTIWNEWADADGELGPVYGHQWRSWPTPDGEHIDQIAQLIREIKGNPDSRRLIVSAWNVGDIPHMALPPCHAFFQFYVAPLASGQHSGESRRRLSCQLYQRSADIFLGVPFNIASYALLVHLVAEQTDLDVGDFVWTGGDCHLYLNHLEQVDTQLARQPHPLPKLVVHRRPGSIFDYRYEDFEIVDYRFEPHIKAPVAV